MAPNTAPVTDDTLITVKITFDDCTKKVKLPLKDLGAHVLPAKLRHLLCIAHDQPVIFERYSDSAGGYVVLDSANPAVFKTLMRAAKAKLKLRLRASAPSAASATPEGPVIARTPVYALPSRDSTALDQRSVGPGIFEFRNAHGPHKQSGRDEAPVPRPFDFVPPAASKQTLALRARPSIDLAKASFSVFCNVCDKALDKAHYHCGICEDGDFDLCESCIDDGKLCPGEGHWLIKRSIQDGKVVSSTTERVAPKAKGQVAPQPVGQPAAKLDTEMDIPGAFTDDVKTLLDPPIRTCNSCVSTLPEPEFVTCVQCEDYDLCRECHSAAKHGHHPGHRFKPAVDGVELSLAEEALLPAGRNVRHGAVCDGCDKAILGVRHKCFNCPDFDYCGECFKNARHTHPRHRFAALYDPIPARRASPVLHHGVYCDGPLCKDRPYQSYVQGVRYKCVVCHDTDFCESCEALPGSSHNKNHPLVKFKTPVNNLTISTESEGKSGLVRKLGDRDNLRPRVQPGPVAPTSNNVTMPVRTVADIKPSPRAEEEKKKKKTEAAVPAAEKPLIEGMPFRATKSPAAQLQGHFVSDRVSDGAVFAPNTRFTQVWTIRNPGPAAWPAGCSVRFVGGDNMLNVDNAHASSVSDIAEATESNVVGREVRPGEEVGFAVLMKAPVREGKSISYWRIKSADGVPFGHRLWCDINVKTDPVKTSQEASAAAAAALPSWQAPASTPPSLQSYYASYKARMDILKTRIDPVAAQEQSIPAALSDVVKRLMEESTSATSQKQVDGSNASQRVESKNQERAQEQSAEAQQDEGDLKGSQMIFPTLDRESPASSTYQSLSNSATTKSHGEEAVSSSPSSKTASSASNTGYEGFEEVSDDLEVLSANESDDDDDGDDGFLTDEEYDVLDASDQETVASMK